jgi:hypothetical protein
VLPPVQAAPGGQRKTNPAAIPRKRHGQPLVLVGGLAGVLVILAGIGVFVLTRNPTKKNAPSRSKETVATAQGAKGPSGTAAEANPEADPVATADETTEAEATPAGPPEASSPRGDLPDLKKWLMAPRGKGGFRDHSQVQVPKAWLETKDAGFALLNVEVEVTNLSPEESLSFKPWTGDAGSSGGCEAIMADASGTRLKGVSARAGGGRSASARRSIGPGEAYVHRLAFVVPKAGATSFRLALSYAAVGQTGYIGFEIPETMFQKEESKPARPSTGPVEEPDTVVRESPTQPRTGEPDTIDDLRSSIEQAKPASAEPGMDAMPKEQPAEMEPEPAPPDSISDLRESIEGEGGEAKDTNNDMKEP